MNTKIKKLHGIKDITFTYANAVEIEELFWQTTILTFFKTQGTFLRKAIFIGGALNVEGGASFSLEKAIFQKSRLSLECDFVHLEDICLSEDSDIHIYAKKVRFRGMIKGVVGTFFLNCNSLDDFADLESFKTAILELLSVILPKKRVHAILAAKKLSEVCQVIVTNQTVLRYAERRMSWPLFRQIKKQGETHELS
jgi:hypothetical protein